ncbi:MAG: class I SAM-dependent methyltransferase, partial [Candidatus Cloacimonadaceae bacterium]
MFFLLLDMLFLRQWYVKKQIRLLLKKNSSLRFYDAGAGFCQYSDYILTSYRNSSVLALDLKEDYLKEYAGYAEQKYPDRFSWICADLVEYIPSDRFNLIAAIDILEHIENDVKVLENFYQCLADGGKLIISTPSTLDETARFTAEHVRPGYAEEE